MNDMRRLLMAAGVLLGLGAAAAGYMSLWQAVRPAFERWWYPPAPPPSSMGRAILKEHQDEQYRETMREYARIKAKIDEARTRGQKVDALDPKMNRVLSYAQSGKFQEANTLLGIIDMQVPRKPEKFDPAGPATQQAMPDQIVPVTSKSSRSASSAKKKRKAKRKAAP